MSGDPTHSSRWRDVALAKLSNVIGQAESERVLAQALQQIRMESFETADDLYRVGSALAALEGFVGTVGALLRLHAVMHGAVGAPRSDGEPGGGGSWAPGSGGSGGAAGGGSTEGTPTPGKARLGRSSSAPTHSHWRGLARAEQEQVAAW
ncbi:MAG: hypothetical protein ABI193_14610 [Minicystis sp.]